MASLARTLKSEMKEVERAETVSFWARTTVAGWAVTSVGGAVVARARSAASAEEERCFILIVVGLFILSRVSILPFSSFVLYW